MTRPGYTTPTNKRTARVLVPELCSDVQHTIVAGNHELLERPRQATEFDLFLNGAWFDRTTQPSVAAAVRHWGEYIGRGVTGIKGFTPHGDPWRVAPRTETKK
jgi:hypothetical protein